MSLYSIIAFNSALNQMRQNQLDSANIDKARLENEDKAEQLDITKRTKEAQIKVQNNQGLISDYQTKTMLDYLKNQVKPHQDLIDATSDAQDFAQHKIDKQTQQAKAVASQAIKDPDVGTMLYGMRQTQTGQPSPAAGSMSVPSAASGINPNLQAGEQAQADKSQQAGGIPSIFPNTSKLPLMNSNQTLGLFSSNPSGNESAQAADAQVRAAGVQQPNQETPGQTDKSTPQQQTPAEEQAPPPLSQALGHLDSTPFGANPQQDYYMPNPNMMAAMKSGEYMVQKPPEIINQENPLRLSERQKFVEDHAKDLMKSGYSRDDVMAQLPSDLAETVNGIGRYQQSEQVLLGGMQATPQVRSAYIGLVRKLFPSYDVNKFSQAQEYRKQLGDDSGNALGSRVVSVNTVADHMAQLGQVAQQLQNQNIPVQNGLINFVRTNLGHPEVTNFDQAREIISNEVESILSQRGASQSGVQRMEKGLNANMSPQQLTEWVKNVTAPLVADRVQALRSQYKANIGAEDNGEILYPETRQRFQELMGKDVFSEFDKGKNPFSSQEIQASSQESARTGRGNVGGVSYSKFWS